MIKVKLKEYLKRYGPSEAVSLVMTVIGANLGMFLFNDVIIAAFIALFVCNLFYYGIIVFQDLNELRVKDGKLGIDRLFAVLRNLAIEFGPAEYLDSFLLRPFLLSVVPLFVPGYSIAIIVGTLIADITYYFPVIIGYESRKRFFKD